MDRVTISNQMGTHLGEKLKSARLAAGLTTRNVEDKLKGRWPASHATVGNYERAKSQPPFGLLMILAEIYGRPMSWFLEKGATLTGIQYRNTSSRVRFAEKHQYEANAARWLEGYERIERFMSEPLGARVAWTSKPPAVLKDVPRFAADVRKALNLPATGPVRSVVEVLEAFGIRLIELPTAAKIDGFAAFMDGSKPVVVLNPTCSEDRMRLSGAHELFHILLGHCQGPTPAMVPDTADADNEGLAFACARHFLLPRPDLEEAFDSQSFVKLVQYREAFGISISAMIYSARQEGTLSDKWARHLWMEMSKRGWRTKEPGTVRPDRATRFEHLIDSAMLNKNLTASQVAEVVGVREDELIARVRLAMGISPEPAVSQPKGGEPTFSGLRLAK